MSNTKPNSDSVSPGKATITGDLMASEANPTSTALQGLNSINGPSPESSGAVVHALRRKWFLSSLLGLCCAAGLAYFSWSTYRPEYVRQMRISVRGDRSILTADRLTQTSLEDRKRRLRETLTSLDLIERALENKNVRNQPEIRDARYAPTWVNERLKIKTEEGSTNVLFSMRGERPELLQAVISSIWETYANDQEHDELRRQRERIEALRRQRSQQQAKLKEVKQRLKDRSGNFDGSSEQVLDEQQLSLAKRLAMVRAQIIETELTIMNDRVDLDYWKSQAKIRQAQRESDGAPSAGTSSDEIADPTPVTVTEADVQRIVQQDPVWKSSEARKLKLQGDEKLYRERYTGKRLAQHLETIHGELAEIEEFQKAFPAIVRQQLETLKNQPGSVSGTVVDGSQIDLAALQTRIELAQRKLKEYQSERDKLQNSLKSFGVESQDLTTEILEAEAIKGINRDLITQHLRAEAEFTELKPEDGRGLVVKESEVLIPLNQRDYQKLALFSLLGFLAPFAVLVWIDLRRKHVNAPVNISEGMGIDLLGVVPRIPRRHLSRVPRSSKQKLWHERFSESVDNVAAMLLRRLRFDNLQCFLVTSAVAREGKTTLASHLAMSLAASGERVVLVDFDLRRPTLNEVFGVSTAPGACEVLAQSVPWQNVVHKEILPNLSLITAGEWQGNSLGALSMGRLKNLMDQLRAEFDIVLLDASPLLPVADARMVGQHVDGAILSLLRDVSLAPRVASAASLLESYRIPLLGAVLTGTSDEVYYKRKPSPVAHAG